MSTGLSGLEKKRHSVLYRDYQNVFSFHEDYWTWEKDERVYLIVRKK